MEYYITVKKEPIINKFSNVAEYKINIFKNQNQQYFHTIAMNNPIIKLRNNITWNTNNNQGIKYLE